MTGYAHPHEAQQQCKPNNLLAYYPTFHLSIPVNAKSHGQAWPETGNFRELSAYHST